MIGSYSFNIETENSARSEQKRKVKKNKLQIKKIPNICFAICKKKNIKKIKNNLHTSLSFIAFWQVNTTSTPHF